MIFILLVFACVTVYLLPFCSAVTATLVGAGNCLDSSNRPFSQIAFAGTSYGGLNQCTVVCVLAGVSDNTAIGLYVVTGVSCTCLYSAGNALSPTKAGTASSNSGVAPIASSAGGSGYCYTFGTIAPPPTVTPSISPPTFYPTVQATVHPTAQPTEKVPTLDPTEHPTAKPSWHPTSIPTGDPSAKPTGAPTSKPTGKPSVKPSSAPSLNPTGKPSVMPTGAPTLNPTRQPTSKPTGRPSSPPTGQPTSQPSAKPTAPTFRPTSKPYAPSGAPSSLKTVTFTVGTTYTFGNVKGESLLSISSDTVYETITRLAPLHSTFEIMSIYLKSSPITGGRLTTSFLRHREREENDVSELTAAQTFFTYGADVNYYFNMINFAGETIDQALSTQIQLIETVGKNGTFQTTLRALAMVNNATQLLNTTVENVNTSAIITDPPSSESNGNSRLTDGQLAGLVIGSVIGFMCLFAILYCLEVYRRQRYSSRSQAADEVNASNVNSPSNDDSFYYPEAVMIRLGEVNKDNLSEDRQNVISKKKSAQKVEGMELEL